MQQLTTIKYTKCNFYYIKIKNHDDSTILVESHYLCTEIRRTNTYRLYVWWTEPNHFERLVLRTMHYSLGFEVMFRTRRVIKENNESKVSCWMLAMSLRSLGAAILGSGLDQLIVTSRQDPRNANLASTSWLHTVYLPICALMTS